MFSNRDYELADRRADQERAEGLRQVQAGLAGPAGATHCVYCQEEIPEGRRKAMPTACDCIDCATGREAGKR